MRYLHIPNFLTKTENLELLDFAINCDRYYSARTTTNNKSHRSAKVLYQFNPWQSLITNKVFASLYLSVERLKLQPFHIHYVESQLTASSNGDYYKAHTDSAENEDTQFRTLSYVYYFFKEPCKFSGGELHFYFEKNPIIVTPINNSIVFFNSKVLHEVKPVTTTEFKHSRFTVNGWVRQTMLY